MVSTLLNTIFSILYNVIVSPLFLIIDLMQAIFQGFAGIGTIHSGHNTITSVNDGGDESTGIVYWLLRSQTVQNLFYALLTLAIVLLVLFTIVAFVKNIYAEKPKPWKDILTSSIKGLAGFFLTPIVCLFGVWVGNILLQALFTATNDGGVEVMSGQVFVAGAYNANRFRTTGGAIDDYLIGQLKGYYPQDARLNRLAEGAPVKNPDGDGWLDNDGNVVTDVNQAKREPVNISQDDMEYCADLADKLYRDRRLTIQSQATIVIFYDMTQINYLMLIVGGVFMIYALGSITFGAIKRLFYLVFLFVLSPLMNAMYPLDDGQAAKGLNKDFYKQAIGVYSAVVGLNLFYAILPLIMSISFYHSLYILTANFQGIIALILMICGLLTVKELIGLIDGYIGSSGVYAAGTSMMASVKGQLSKYGKKAGKVVGEFGRVHGARKAAIERGENPNSVGAKVFFGDIGKGLSKTMGDWTGINPDAWIQDAKKGSKEGVEAYREISGKKDSKSELKKIDAATTKEELDELEKKYGTRNKEEAKAAAKSPYKRAELLAAGGGVAAVGNDQEKIIEQIQKAIDAIKKLDEKDQKPMLEQLAKSLGKDGHADMTSQTWYKEGMSAEDAVTAAQQHLNITTLQTQFQERAAESRYLSNQQRIDELGAKSDLTDDERTEKAKLEKENDKFIRGRAGVADSGTLSIEDQAKVDAKKAELIGSDLGIKAESIRQLAISIGEQLARALQGAESTTNSNEKFAEFANNISANLKSTMESLQAKGGKSDDKLASTLEKINTSLSKLPQDIKTAVEKIVKPGTGSSKPGSGSGGST